MSSITTVSIPLQRGNVRIADVRCMGCDRIVRGNDAEDSR